MAVLLDVRFGAGGRCRRWGPRTWASHGEPGREQEIGGQTWTGPGGATTGRGWIGLDGADALGQQRREGCLSVCLVGPAAGWVRGSGERTRSNFFNILALFLKKIYLLILEECNALFRLETKIL